MNRKITAIAALTLGLASAAVYAAKPADIIAARQANFKVIGKSFKGIMDEMRKPAPDMAMIKASANALAGGSSKVSGYFPKGSGPEAGAKTHALPAIWAKNADFKKSAANLVAASKKMQLAANSNNIDTVKAAFPALGGTCKGCHDQFKAKD